MSSAISPTWVVVLTLSIAADTAATAYLKLAGERWQGTGFFVAALSGVVAYAPSIVLLGYALKAGPSYLASIGIWFVGSYAANALLGVVACGDPFSPRIAAGLGAAAAAVVLLTPR